MDLQLGFGSAIYHQFAKKEVYAVNTTQLRSIVMVSLPSEVSSISPEVYWFTEK